MKRPNQHSKKKAELPCGVDASMDDWPDPQRNVAGQSFTLQAIFEIQKSVGQLQASVDRLDSKVEKLDDSVSDVSGKVSRINMILFAASIILTISITLGGFLANKIWDSVANHVEITAK